MVISIKEFGKIEASVKDIVTLRDILLSMEDEIWNSADSEAYSEWTELCERIVAGIRNDLPIEEA